MVGNRAPTDGSSAESPRLQRRHSFGLGVLVGLAIAAILGLVLVAPIALAHHDASSLETAYGNAVITGLSRLNAGNVGANPTTANARSLQRGRQSYTGSCSQCHGAGGHTQGAFGQTSFPPATDLTSDATSSLSDGQMFYIIKNGLGFTPMPAFSRQFRHPDLEPGQLCARTPIGNGTFAGCANADTRPADSGETHVRW